MHAPTVRGTTSSLHGEVSVIDVHYSDVSRSCGSFIIEREGTIKERLLTFDIGRKDQQQAKKI